MGPGKILWVAALLTAGLAANGVRASEDSLWTSEVELGAVFTSGNTDEQNVKFRAQLVRDAEMFKHTMYLDHLDSSKDNNKTAQKTYMYYQGDYKLLVGSLFGRVSYEQDQFNGFDYQADVSAGYSRLLMEKATMKLSGDIGLGYRISAPDTGSTDGEAIVRLAGAFSWDISQNATFKQLLSTEIGADSTISRSESSVSANIAGDLAMKFSINVKNNSSVPAGRQETDTESSVTLVYKF